MITVESVTKGFRTVQALDGVSFTARDGEILGLVGPNGAGKTTLIRILATVLKPDSGRALIDGCDVATRRLEAQRRIGVLPDARGLYPRLTAREHLRYFGSLHGMAGRRLAERVDELCRSLTMDEIADRRAKGFSRGQSLKVALGRAMIHDPPNLLLDEPTNGLDIAASRVVRDLMRALRDEGRCVIFCSHIMEDVASLCDRLVVLADGKVAAAGTLEELRGRCGRERVEDVFLAVTGREI
jgi:sodium transport system ATP-binding protein